MYIQITDKPPANFVVLHSIKMYKEESTLHNEDHCDINRLPSVMTVTSRRPQWFGHVALIWGDNEYT
jgi:hypothetical protein